MNVETKQVKLSELKLNTDNPRRIGNKEMERLVKSLGLDTVILQIK